MRFPSVVIVSPALAAANNGNWQTARRWQRLLGPTHRVRITQDWPDPQAQGDEVMLALHARRSATAIHAWAASRGAHGLAVVLTGTDLYRDIDTDSAARRSLACAQALVVLQELGLRALPPEVRAKARVIHQSTSMRSTLKKTARVLRAVMVGHLREVKDPRTLFNAARMLPPGSGIELRHIGEAMEADLGEAALQTAQACPHYQWLGGKPHSWTRQAIQRAHVLVHTSAVEGGAHVVMEAVCSGTPVIASRIDGNVGLLGQDYEGYFEPGNASQLASLLLRCRAGQAVADESAPAFLERLRGQCALRASLFVPDAERAALRRLVNELSA